MRNRPIRLTALLLTALCLLYVTAPAQRRRQPRPSAFQKSTDWAFPHVGMRSTNVDGGQVYNLGDGFTATYPRPSSDGGQHVIVAISPDIAAQFNNEAEEHGDNLRELLANGVFYKVCKTAAQGSAFLGSQQRALQLSPDSTVTEYLFRTLSGATARVQLAEDGRMAIVVLPPSQSGVAGGRPASVGQRSAANRGASPRRYTFEELRVYYMSASQADVLRALGKPYSTYDTGERVAWTYRNLAYDPVLGRYKDVIIWFGKYGSVDRISER